MSSIQPIKNFNESQVSLTTPTWIQTGTQGSGDTRRIAPIPLSTSDLLLFAGGLVSLAASVLNNRLDTSSPLLSIIGKVAAIGMILGEFSIIKEELETNQSVFLKKIRHIRGILYTSFGSQKLKEPIQNLRNLERNKRTDAAFLVGTKWLMLATLKQFYTPKTHGQTVITTALTAIFTVDRAIRELQKTFQLENPKEHVWDIARNTFVHGFNASYPLYNIGALFLSLVSSIHTFPIPSWKTQ